MDSIDSRGSETREYRWRRAGAWSPSLPGRRWMGWMPLMLVPALWIGTREGGRDAAPPPPPAAEVPKIVGTELPLHVNARVEKWLRRFATTQRAEFQALLEREGIYAGMIRSKLRERGMPEELLYMAMMESGLSPWARSSASAVGLWQFMSPTALQYGLRVDAWVDERRDPVRATDAALDYLQALYRQYGSWYLAAAAYNAGPSRVSRALNRHAHGRTGDEDLYWEVIDYLPRETREYVPRLVAATLLATDPEARGFRVRLAEPYRYDVVWVPGATPLWRIARALDVKPSLIRGLNPHLIRGVTPPGEIYGVRVPVGRSPRVVAALGRHAARWRSVD